MHPGPPLWAMIHVRIIMQGGEPEHEARLVKIVLRSRSSKVTIVKNIDFSGPVARTMLGNLTQGDGRLLWTRGQCRQ